MFPNGQTPSNWKSSYLGAAALEAELRYTSLDPLAAFDAAIDVLAIEVKSRSRIRNNHFLPERALVAYAAMLCIVANLDEASAELNRCRADPRVMVRVTAKAQLRADLEGTRLTKMHYRLAQLLTKLQRFEDIFRSGATYLAAAKLRYAADFPFTWWRPVYQNIFHHFSDRDIALGVKARETFIGFLGQLANSVARETQSNSLTAQPKRGGTLSKLRISSQAISTSPTPEAVEASFYEAITLVLAERRGNPLLDGELKGLLVAYHALHHTMQQFLSEYQQQLTAPKGNWTQLVHGMRLNSAANQLIQRIEGMYSQFSAALSQSRLMQAYALTDRRQYEVLLSPVFRMEHSFEVMEHLYLRIFRPVHDSRYWLADSHDRSWIESRLGIGRESHVVWGNFLEQ